MPEGETAEGAVTMVQLQSMVIGRRQPAADHWLWLLKHATVPCVPLL